MDFTGSDQEVTRGAFEVWRKTRDGECFVSKHDQLHLAQLVKMRGGPDYVIRCRPWPQTTTPHPGLWQHWVTPLGLLSMVLASVLAGWLILHGGVR